MTQPSLISNFHDDIQENSSQRILNLPCGSAILTFTVTITNEVAAHKLLGRWQSINQQLYQHTTEVTGSTALLRPTQSLISAHITIFILLRNQYKSDPSI